ncbi:unnamed protein product [Lampetra planeri]
MRATFPGATVEPRVHKAAAFGWATAAWRECQLAPLHRLESASKAPHVRPVATRPEHHAQLLAHREVPSTSRARAEHEPGHGAGGAGGVSALVTRSPERLSRLEAWTDASWDCETGRGTRDSDTAPPADQQLPLQVDTAHTPCWDVKGGWPGARDARDGNDRDGDEGGGDRAHSELVRAFTGASPAGKCHCGTERLRASSSRSGEVCGEAAASKPATVET